MAHLTSALVSTALDHDGTFHLPYQQHYTRAELERPTRWWMTSSR